jgi:hypothetical protein
MAMEMAVRSIEMAEMAMETDGDGSGGTSPCRQGAGTKTSAPRNSLVAAAELQNSSGNFADSPRVFRPEASYRRRGVVRRRPGRSHNGWARPGTGSHPPIVWAAPGPPSGSRSVFGPLPGKIRLLELVSSNSENIFCVAFLKHKNSKKQGTGTVASC